MAIPRAVKRIAIKGSILLGVFFGLNHCTNNFEYEDDTSVMTSKYDFPLGHTILFQYKTEKYTYVTDVGPFSFSRYTLVDGDFYGGHDGLVDKIHIERKGKETISLWRKKHYETHMEEFDKADQELKKAKQRFKEYLLYE